MQTRSVNWGLSSLLHRRLMSLMHRSVCWTSSVVCGCCEHLTYTFWWLRDSSVRNVKRFRIEAPKTFWNVAEHMRCSKDWNWDFRLVPTSRGMRPLTSFLSLQTKGEKLNRWDVHRLSECHNRLNRVGVNLPDEIVIVLHSHCHQASRASWWTITYQG
jgi:hypothetical protein